MQTKYFQVFYMNYKICLRQLVFFYMFIKVCNMVEIISARKLCPLLSRTSSEFLLKHFFGFVDLQRW